MLTVIKRVNVPRIHGSLSAFIAVVVTLSIIIIASCIGIFILLREHHTLDEERPHRHHQNLPYSAQRIFYRFKSLTRRLAWLFGYRRANPVSNRPPMTGRLTMRGRSSQGWIQAGSTDDWEVDAGKGGSRGTVQEIMQETRSTSPQTILQSTPVSSRSTPDSSSSVRFDLPARDSSYFERNVPPSITLPSIHSQLSLPSFHSSDSPVSSTSVFRTLSPEPLPTLRENESLSHHHYVTSTGVVMQTLPGGTKFVEAL